MSYFVLMRGGVELSVFLSVEILDLGPSLLVEVEMGEEFGVWDRDRGRGRYLSGWVVIAR